MKRVGQPLDCPLCDRTADRAQPIPPEVDHQVEPRDGARFHLTFLVRPAEVVDEGGEAPCFAHLLEPDELT